MPIPISARSFFTGSHENAMLALAQGTVDVAANQWTSDDELNTGADAAQGDAEEYGRHADEEGRFQDHSQIGADHQTDPMRIIRSFRMI